jgi:hypothetical protein
MDGKRNKHIFAGYIEETETKPVLWLRSQSALVKYSQHRRSPTG